MELRIGIDGLDELVAKLAQAADDGVFTKAHRDVAEHVDAEAKSRANTRQMQRAVQNNQIKVLKRGPAIRIGGGGGDGRWALGAQYGAHVLRQFPGYIDGGYTVEPAIDDQLDAIGEMYADAVLDQF